MAQVNACEGLSFTMAYAIGEQRDCAGFPFSIRSVPATVFRSEVSVSRVSNSSI